MGFKLCCKWFFNQIKLHIYEILYILLLVILSFYIIENWNSCIEMKFFDQFNGNNILFLVWILLLILPFYDVEAKGWKFHRRGVEDMRRALESADSDFAQKQINNIRNTLSPKSEENGTEVTAENE